jgi:hypothetical protein
MARDRPIGAAKARRRHAASLAGDRNLIDGQRGRRGARGARLLFLECL